jgi:hypothetical protein
MFNTAFDIGFRQPLPVIKQFGEFSRFAALAC